MRPRTAVLLAAVLVSTVPSRADEEIRWLAREPAGILPLEEESALVVRGVTGLLEVRTGSASEIRWACAPTRGSGETPLAVGGTDRELVLTVPPGDTVPRRMVVTVPARLAVRIEADASEVVGSNIESPLTVIGRDLSVRLLTPSGQVDLELTGGSAIVERARGRTAIRGRPEKVAVVNPAGPVLLTVEAGTIEVQGAKYGFDADIQGAKLKVEGAAPSFHVRARQAEVVVKDLQGGGDFDMTGSPLRLLAASGEVTVNTDALVEFKDCTAELHVHGIAAPVRGSDHHGLVEIETDSSEVLLSKIDGPLRVRGNSLQLRLEQTAETGLITSGSTIEATNVGGPLSIENDLGTVTVRGATAKVEVKNRGGDVTLQGLSAPANVETSSDTLTVGFASLPRDMETESVLINDDGVVRVELPPGGQVEVDAQSRYGRVESSLDWIRVSDDGRSAKGLRGRQKVPRLRIVGEGGVVLGGPGAAEAVEQDGGGEP